MDRRSFLKNFPKGIMIGIATAHAFKSYAGSAVCEALPDKPIREKDPGEILKEIYREVLELGSRDNEDFIKREFHMNLDGNEEKKEEHVVVFSYKVGDKEKMIVQVTYFEAKRKNSVIKYAKDIRKILCVIRGDKIEIEGSDYNEREIKSLLPEILQGIQNKKELLKLLDRKK